MNTFSTTLTCTRRTTSGSLDEIYFKSGTGWSGWQSLGGSLTGSPCAVNNPGKRSSRGVRAGRRLSLRSLVEPRLRLA